jgi:hypothetical protein
LTGGRVGSWTDGIAATLGAVAAGIDGRLGSFIVGTDSKPKKKINEIVIEHFSR